MQFDQLKRREFITLLGGVATWPLAARAQQGGRMRRVGVLMNFAADDTDAQTRIGAFLQALQQLGWTIGRNVRIETRWSGGKSDDVRRYAAELVALAPDVILAHGTSTVRPLLQATRTVPIVFPVVGDPVAGGFRVVASEVSADTSAYPVEGFGGIGATIQCVSRQQLRPRGPMQPAIGGLLRAIEA
jgi:putative ABC transport system substrate-binding protein